MRIAFCSDEPYRVHERIRAICQDLGHEIVPFGAALSGEEEPWALVAEEAAMAVASGRCQEGIFCCWSGTGISMAANKVAGIRAALVTDPGGAAAARIWNHANVICLSNRLLSDDMAGEILRAWFETEPGVKGGQGVALLAEVDARHRR